MATKMNDTRNNVKRIKPNSCLPGEVFLDRVREATAFKGRTEILTAGTSRTVR